MIALAFLVGAALAAFSEDMLTPRKTAAMLFSPEEFQSRLGTNERAFNGLPRFYHPREKLGDLPTEFDARKEWPSCTMPVRDQASCGSCWSFGAAEALADRVCINGLLDHGIDISTQWMVNCDRGNMGCYGGTLPNVWGFLAIFGSPEDSCLPYEARMFDCTTTCADGSTPTMYFASAPKYFPADDLESIMYEIMTNGPVETAFSVYEDFYDEYKGGVYKYDHGAYKGGHAIKCLGWGHDDETGHDYWIAQNSWGPEWGEAGFFRIHRGANDCGFEGQMTAGRAAMTPYEPPRPEFAANYYTVLLQESQNTRVGIRMWVKDHGTYSRLEEYHADYKNTTVIKTGNSSAGWAVSHVKYADDGYEKCICQKGSFHAEDVFDIPEEYKYTGSMWSGSAQDFQLQEQILSEYTYEVPGLETMTYQIAAASVEGAATPWAMKSTVFGVNTHIDVSIYDARSLDSSLFVEPCKCK